MVYLPLGSIMEWDDNKITEHNRSPISIDEERIEVKRRMANGSLRRWTTSIKRKYSFSYSAIPSNSSKTVDGAWGGKDMKAFHDTNSSFSLKIRYGDGTVETIEAVISTFDVEIVKRGPVSDLWDISIELEEV